MYNGIGLKTPRGSGTNGYVVKNNSALKPSTFSNAYNSKKSPLYSDTQAAAVVPKARSEEILKHDRKRKIEVKVVEYMDELEERGK